MCWFHNRVVVAFTGLALALTLPRQAEAQRSGRSGLRLGNVAPVQLLALADIQSELKLIGEQQTKLAAIHDKLTSDRRKLFVDVPKESGERGPKLAKLNKRATAEIETILDKKQRQRLQEIWLQVNGAYGLEKKEIADAIGISDDQKEKLARIQRINSEARRDARKEVVGSPAQKRNAKMPELHR